MRKMKELSGAVAALALMGGLAVQAAPILFDLNNSSTSRGGSYVEAAVSDFQDLGITENILGADVINVLQAHNTALNYSNAVNGITITSSGNLSTYTGSATPNNVLREYTYSATTITISGLDAYLDDGGYALYLAGVGDKANQNSTFTFNGESLSTSTLNPQTVDATNFVVRFTFEKTNGLDSISFDSSAKFNGFAIVSTNAAGPDVTTAITPVSGATYVTNLPTIEVQVTDGEKVVDTSSFTMALVVDGVTNDVSSEVVVGTKTGGVTPFTYTPVMMLENGAEYTVLYSVAGIGGSALNYLSTFTTAPDLHYGTTPADGSLYVATNAEVSVVFTNVAVSLSNLYTSAELIVNSTDVSADLVVSYPTNGVMKFEYAHSGLDFGLVYDVQLNVSRSDGHTNRVEFAFDSAVDPSVYLIAPGLRNGGFELVDGVAGYGPIMSDWSRIDDWSDDSGAGAKTEAIASPTEGTRALVTGAGSESYNISTHAISDGDIFEFKWTVPGRANGVSVGLAYEDGGVIQVVSNSLVYTTGTLGEFSGSYLFDAVKDPDAIGHPVGVIIIDDNTGGGAVYVDEVRLYYGNIAVQSISPAADATGVSAAAPIEVVIAEAASQVDTNSLVLTVDGVNVTAESVINDTASGVTITYAPATGLSVGKHFVSVSATGMPEGAASRSWSFLVDPNGTYLISPDLRNGSFELVSGVQGSGTVNDWTLIDDWGDDSGAGAKTENNSLATDGSRIFVTGTGSETYNITGQTIGNGDRYGYSFVVAGRSFGVTVALAYQDGPDVVVVSNSMNYVTGGSTPFSVSGAYTFTAGADPDAIGNPVGIIFIDDAAGSGSVQLDEVRFFTDESSPTEEPVITEFSISGSTVTLSWESQNLGLYSLQSKQNLVLEDWVTVLSNLPSGNLTTNVPLSGADQEFFRVISE